MTVLYLAHAAKCMGHWRFGCIVPNWPIRHNSWVVIAGMIHRYHRVCLELAILTTARIWDAAFEWQAHVLHALAAGIDQAVVDALAADHDPDFPNDDEQLVYEFSRELNLTRAVSDALYARAINVLGEEGTVDLVGVLGYYALISMTIKAFDVDPITAS